MEYLTLEVGETVSVRGGERPMSDQRLMQAGAISAEELRDLADEAEGLEYRYDANGRQVGVTTAAGREAMREEES